MFKHMLFGFVVAAISATTVQAHTPVLYLEVLEGKPSNMIEHGVELQSVLDQKKAETDLEGPHHFSLAVGCLGRKVKDEKAYLAWYKIVNAKKQAPRKVAVLDLIRGSESTPLTIGAAEYFLTPAQRITTGPPSEIPGGLDHYKAYRILDAPSRELVVTLTDSAGPAERKVGKPIFLCVAAKEWHHEEHFPASHPEAGFVVYELDDQEHAEKFSLIDQFGLNQVTVSKSRWLCVRAMLPDDDTE